MTLPPRPTYSCLGKESFAEKHHADQAARRASRHSRTPISTYRCTYCHAWHVGSGIVPKRKRSAIAKRGRT